MSHRWLVYEPSRGALWLANPGPWRSPILRLAASSRRGWADGSVGGSHTSAARSAAIIGINVPTIVDLPEAERTQLDALCRQRGLSRAEALRQEWDSR